MFLRALFAIAWIAALFPLVMFVLLIGYGSLTGEVISSFVALLGAGLILWGGHALAARGKNVAAGLLLAILAVPAVLYCLFWLLLIISNPRWN